MSKKSLCKVYRCTQKDGMYLYVDHTDDLSRVPEALLSQVGRLELAMTMPIWAERQLAQTDGKKVLAAFKEEGFYLQMPPPITADDQLAELM